MITVDKYGSTNYNYDMFSYIKQITYKYHINFERKKTYRALIASKLHASPPPEAEASARYKIAFLGDSTTAEKRGRNGARG